MLVSSPHCACHDPPQDGRPEAPHLIDGAGNKFMPSALVCVQEAPPGIRKPDLEEAQFAMPGCAIVVAGP
jgi:hypothetical protein